MRPPSSVQTAGEEPLTATAGHEALHEQKALLESLPAQIAAAGSLAAGLRAAHPSPARAAPRDMTLPLPATLALLTDRRARVDRARARAAAARDGALPRAREEAAALEAELAGLARRKEEAVARAREARARAEEGRRRRRRGGGEEGAVGEGGGGVDEGGSGGGGGVGAVESCLGGVGPGGCWRRVGLLGWICFVDFSRYGRLMMHNMNQCYSEPDAQSCVFLGQVHLSIMDANHRQRSGPS